MRTRLLISYIVVVLTSLIVGFLVAAMLVRNTIVEQMKQVQSEEAAPFLAYFQDYYEKNDGWEGVESLDPGQIIAQVAPPEARHYDLAIIDAHGIILMVENPATKGIKVTEATLQTAAPIIVKGETVGYLLSGNFIDRILTSVSDPILNRSMMALVRAMIIGLLIGFLMSTFMIRAILRPISTTIAATRKISQGNLSLRVPLEPYRDMSELGQAVNEMAADLERNQESQRFMLMDIAHDLRTPLSVQKATIEGFEDGVYEFNQAGLSQLKQQNTQLIRLVEDIRLLTLTDTGDFRPKKVPVEINGYLEKILYNFTRIFAKKSIGIDYTPIPNDCMVEFDPHLMTRVFENLLQNAYQHSPEDTVLDVKLNQKSSRVVATIRDHGPGIPNDKLETIFKRYYRVRQVAEGEPEGLGLGLTITKRIVESHGGKVFARNCEDGGAEFVIELPYNGSTSTK